MSFLILHFFTGVKLFNSSRRFPVHPSFGGLRSPRPRWGTADAETKVPLCVCGWVGVWARVRACVRVCERARARMCVYMLYIYVCVRARARMDVRESARARVCVCVCARADVCERGRVRVCIRVCVCVRARGCVYICYVYVSVRACVRACVCVCARACVRGVHPRACIQKLCCTYVLHYRKRLCAFINLVLQ